MDKKPDQIIKEIELKVAREMNDYWSGKENSAYLTPKLTDDYQVILSAWYEHYSDELADIEKAYPTQWIKIRQDASSVKETDMLYDKTKQGQRRIELKRKLKSLSKMISSLKKRLRRMEMEAIGHY